MKVLDFGLAKALDTTPAGDPSQSPTLTVAATQMGVIMGTAAYMSPEQARGKPVDKRADIWAFGVVLYEMLTGRRPFEAEDVALVLAEVMKSEPNLAALDALAPTAVRRLLHRSLEKDPRVRLRDIGEARILLAAASSGVTGASEDADTPPTPAPPTTLPAGRRLAPVIADGVGSTELIYQAPGLIAVPQSWASGDDATLVFDEVDDDGDVDIKLVSMDERREVRPLVATLDSEREAAISPDGRWLAYASDRSGSFEVFVQSFPDLESQVQVSRGGGTEPRWTRTGGDRELFYRDLTGVVQAVGIGPDGAPTGEPEPIFRRAEMLISYGAGARNYAVAEDGSELYAIVPGSTAQDGAGGLVLVDNWFQELATMVPAP